MNVRDALLWPVYRVAGWIDERPLSAAGVLVALGASGCVLLEANVESGSPGTADGHLAGVALATAVETALTQPAYAVAVLVGLAVFLLYDG